jgi:hypothetical protein
MFATLLAKPIPARGEDAFVGFQAIGLSKWRDADVRWLADRYGETGGNLELSCLPFTFATGNKAMRRCGLFVMRCFRKADSGEQRNKTTLRLRFTVYLWFHRDEYFINSRGNVTPFPDETFRWGVFSRLVQNGVVLQGAALEQAINQLTLEQRRFLTEYQRRVDLYAAWAQAIQQKYPKRLSLTLCPYLEDTNLTALSDYNALLVWLQSKMPSGVTITYRRSSNETGRPVAPGSTDTIPLESHGNLSIVSSLIAGDVYSNDGCPAVVGSVPSGNCQNGDPSDVTTVSFAALARGHPGKSFLLWRDVYNTNSRDGTKPRKRTNLHPFTPSDGRPDLGEQQVVTTFLTATKNR